jgi:hypothetical protein
MIKSLLVRNYGQSMFMLNKNQYIAATVINNTKRLKREVPDGEILEKEVERTKKGEAESTIAEFPGWNEVLASDSEADVKADRYPKKDFKELQKETIEIIQKKAKKGQYPLNA